MLFDAKTDFYNGAGTVPKPKTLSFDWLEERYRMVDGSPLEVTEVESAKQWIEQCIRTVRGKYTIYPINYGCSALDIRGYKKANNLALPELERELKEAIVYCDEIADVGNVRFSDGKIKIDCVINDKLGVIEIEGY